MPVNITEEFVHCILQSFILSYGQKKIRDVYYRSIY